jgi:lipopolysaccharide biosynthesis glycosyltransferase
MKRIERIIVAGCARDFWLTRICVASIRYWYPDIPIGLIKDRSQGDFDIEEMTAAWNVHLLANPDPPKGKWSKLEAFFQPNHQRFLLLDSDTVFLGPVLAELEKREEDFIVHWEGTEPLSEEEKLFYANKDYFQLEKLRSRFPDYEAPDYFFNGGHLVLTSGIVEREDFYPFWTEDDPPEINCRDIFHRNYDQGLLNFILAEKQRQNLASVGACNFVCWPTSEITPQLQLEKLQKREGYPYLFHWAGVKPYFKSGLRRADVLGFYEDYYYSRIPEAARKRVRRLWERHQAAQPPVLRHLWKLQGRQSDFFKLWLAERKPKPEENRECFLRITGKRDPRFRLF